MIIIGDIARSEESVSVLVQQKRISPLPQDHGNHPPKRCPWPPPSRICQTPQFSRLIKYLPGMITGKIAE